MSSWLTILGFGPPVVGQTDDYRVAAQQSEDLREACQQVNDAFSSVRNCASEGLKGETADSLRELVSNVDEHLKHLPIVLGDVSDILRAHERDLEQLKCSVREALARATVRWDTLQDTERTVNSERGELSYLQSQRNRTPRIPENEDHIARLNSLISAQIAQVQQCEAQRDEAKATICRNMPLGKHPGNCSGVPDRDAVHTNTTSCSEHVSLSNQEQALVRRTVLRLGETDLRELRDPNLLQQLGGWFGDRVSDFGGWLGDLLGDIGKLGKALLDGDWGAALHYLRDTLDKLTTIIIVAALLVGVLLAPFTGGASLAIGGVIAAKAGLIGGGINLGLTLGLSMAGTPHPETNRPLGAWDIGLSVIGVVPFGKGAKIGVGKYIKKQIRMYEDLSKRLRQQQGWLRKADRARTKGGQLQGDGYKIRHAGIESGDKRLIEIGEERMERGIRFLEEANEHSKMAKNLGSNGRLPEVERLLREYRKGHMAFEQWDGNYIEILTDFSVTNVARGILIDYTNDVEANRGSGHSLVRPAGMPKIVSVY